MLENIPTIKLESEISNQKENSTEKIKHNLEMDKINLPEKISEPIKTFDNLFTAQVNVPIHNSNEKIPKINTEKVNFKVNENKSEINNLNDGIKKIDENKNLKEEENKLNENSSHAEKINLKVGVNDIENSLNSKKHLKVDDDKILGEVKQVKIEIKKVKGDIEKMKVDEERAASNIPAVGTHVNINQKDEENIQNMSQKLKLEETNRTDSTPEHINSKNEEMIVQNISSEYIALSQGNVKHADKVSSGKDNMSGNEINAVEIIPKINADLNAKEIIAVETIPTDKLHLHANKIKAVDKFTSEEISKQNEREAAETIPLDGMYLKVNADTAAKPISSQKIGIEVNENKTAKKVSPEKVKLKVDDNKNSLTTTVTTDKQSLPINDSKLSETTPLSIPNLKLNDNKQSSETKPQDRAESETYLQKAKNSIDEFIHHPLDTTYNVTSFLISPFNRIYSTLSTPNEKDENNFLNQYVIPSLKVFCFFFSLISIFAFTIYSSMIAGNMLTKKYCNSGMGEGDKNTFFKKKLNLKGRTKKNPNNINYNELFKDNEEKYQSVKNGNFNSDTKNEIENDLDDKHCRNLEDFFDRVNERKEFQKFFHEDNENMNGYNHPNQNINQSTNDNKHISIVLKNNADNLIHFDDQFIRNIKKTPEVKYTPKVKEIEREIIIDKLECNDFDDMNLENSLEIRKRNPSLFHKTPLANIRKNTMSSQK